MPQPTADDSLALAERHLQRVVVSWDPPNWLDLATFGFYALEAAVMAAGLHLSHPVRPSHPAKAQAAKDFATAHGLPDVSSLLRDLNEARKSEAYGDVAFPTGLDAEDVATAIEQYIEALRQLLGK